MEPTSSTPPEASSSEPEPAAAGPGPAPAAASPEPAPAAAGPEPAPAAPAPAAVHSPDDGHGNGHGLAALSLGALGVVYGDIGTSPLYAIKECLGSTSEHAVASSPDNVLGVMSLVFWALTLVVVVKYLGFVLRADNRGEGGILALAALLRPQRPAGKLVLPVLLALFGAGLLYGDGVITPAISVLGAMEGLEVATSSLKPVIVPATVAILVGLFLVQRHGTHRIGSIFGWVMLLWFVAIGAAGVPHLARHPEVLKAINPIYGVRFFADHGVHGFLLLGSVVLVVTGGEALYADMGHFGKRPIRVAWFAVVMPGLLLNYFGQAALLISAPEKTIENPFFALVDGPLLYPMVVIATLAAIIASQALISGAYSLTQQAVQLGYLPRVTIVHTSEKAQGQIYIPEVNWLLMVGTVLIVIGFGSSSNLAAAYGIAVTGTMAITTYLYYLVARRNWAWPLGYGMLVLVGFLIFDLSFLGANVVKIQHGGWVPLVIGTGLFVIMTTWWKGRLELSRAVDSGSIPDELFLADLAANPLPRVRGTAVFMTSNPAGFPNVLLHHVKHNQVLHQQIVLLSIETTNVPLVPRDTALEVIPLGHGFHRVLARTGFMQSFDAPRMLQRCADRGLVIDLATTTYYLGRQTLRTGHRGGFARWRKLLFGFLARNAKDPTAFFQLPPNRVVELGLQIEL